MTTTLNSIKAAVETLIAGLNPTGQAYTQRKYMRAAPGPWDERPDSDVDRRFTVQVKPDGAWKSFGLLTEHTATVAMSIIVGHTKAQNLSTSEERKDTDLRQIVLELADPANRPTGVWRIAPLPAVATDDRDGWWKSEIKCVVTFSEANP